MNLVEMMDDSVDWVEGGSVGIIFTAAVLIHQVVRGSVGERYATELSGWGTWARDTVRVDASCLTKLLGKSGGGCCQDE